MDSFQIFDFDLVMFLATSCSKMLTDEEKKQCNSSSWDSPCQELFSREFLLQSVDLIFLVFSPFHSSADKSLSLSRHFKFLVLQNAKSMFLSHISINSSNHHLQRFWFVLLSIFLHQFSIKLLQHLCKCTKWYAISAFPDSDAIGIQ